MSDATRPAHQPPRRAGGQASAKGEGRWGMDLWSGCAWFSTWFYRRLNWNAGFERKRLDALKAHLPDGAWETLLLAIRNHLEQRRPLDLQVCARLPDGRMEWWLIEGLAERNASGQPVYLDCRTRALSPEHRDPFGDAS